MKRIILLSVILFIAFLKINAQTPLEVVYLKNGSVIRGVVLEQVPNQFIKLETSDGSIFVYSVDEIEKITKEFSQKSKSGTSAVNYDLEGYRGFIDVGYLFGVGDEYSKVDRIELSTAHGYQFNNHFFLGAGVGMHYLTLDNVFMLPVFVNFKGYLLNNPISPFLDLKGGYSPILTKLEDDDIKGGLYISPSIGVRFIVADNIGMSVGLGFNFQQIKDIELREYGSMNAVSLKLGVEF